MTPLSYPMVLASDCVPSPVAKASVPVLGGSAVAEDRLCVMLSVMFGGFSAKVVTVGCNNFL